MIAEAFEGLGICEATLVYAANEKRVCQYDRQCDEALHYALEGYAKDWDGRLPSDVTDVAGWIVKHRRAYEQSFISGEGQTQLGVSVPVEGSLRKLFSQARDEVMNCLLTAEEVEVREDIHHSAIWVPSKFAHIPEQDFHVTLCIPTGWRLPESDPVAHDAYNESVAEAFSSAAAGHAAFELEVDRVMLNQDGSLVAVFRTVVHRQENDAAEVVDPINSLRSDLLYNFFQEGLANFQRSTDAPHLEDMTQSQRPRLLRQASIVKTVGGSAHGYIHCSLSRLAISPALTQREVDFLALQRVCQSLTSRLVGHRMTVRGFKLTELTGLGVGGNKNPYDKARWSKDILLGSPRESLKSTASCSPASAL